MHRGVLILSLVAVAILAINLANAPSTSGDAVNTPVVIFNETWWGIPHVYQGLTNIGGEFKSTNQWPRYHGLLLEFTNGNYTAGAVFWRGNYSGSSYIEISILATYTTGSPSGGFEFYLFLEPKTWSVYDKCNYSIPFEVSRYYHPYPPAVVILPRGIVKHFIVVQWVSSCYGGKGQWSVLVENGTTASRWLYVGNGCVKPHPGDHLNLTVSYNATANELNGTIVDLSRRANSSLFTLKLGGNYTAPVRGNYTFGVGAFTLAPGANWGVTEVVMVGVEGVNTTQPPLSVTPPITTITVTKAVTATTTITRTTTMTNTTTSTTTTTISIPITTTTTSTMTIASTVTVTTTVPKPVLNIPLTTALVVIIIVLAVVAVVGYRRRYYADVATI
ncbi:MAG: hypothetical protein RXQ00_05015 [Caldivirga sp.]